MDRFDTTSLVIWELSRSWELTKPTLLDPDHFPYIRREYLAAHPRPSVGASSSHSALHVSGSTTAASPCVRASPQDSSSAAATSGNRAKRTKGEATTSVYVNLRTEAGMEAAEAAPARSCTRSRRRRGDRRCSVTEQDHINDDRATK